MAASGALVQGSTAQPLTAESGFVGAIEIKPVSREKKGREKMNEYVNNRSHGLTRRSFLKLAAGAGAFVTLPGLLAARWPDTGPFAEAARQSEPAFPYPESGSADLQGDLKAWVWWPGKDTLEKMLPEFNKLFPNVKVTVEELGNEDVHSKLSVAIESGAGAPDVAWVDQMRIGKFIAQGGIIDVRPAITPYLDKFIPFKVRTVQGPDGEIFGWPNDIGPTGLWYNKAVFDKYGIAVPTTWDEYLEAGRTMKKDGVALHSIPPTDYFGSLWLGDLVHQNGGSFFAADGKATIDTPEVIEVLGYLRKLIDEGLVSQERWWEAEFFKSWNDGKLATFITGAWQGLYWRDSLGKQAGEDTGVRFALCPRFKAGGAVSGNDGGAYFVVTRQSKSQDAANAFCRFVLTSLPGGMGYRDVGLIPAYVPNLKDPEALKKEYPEFGNQQIWQLTADLADSMPAGYLYPAPYAEVWNAMTEKWPDFYKGMAPEAWAKEMQTRAEEIVQQYQP
jgi:ABC-type glycerol-3-phosphate transport system substrate-binding protein